MVLEVMSVFIIPACLLILTRAFLPDCPKAVVKVAAACRGSVLGGTGRASLGIATVTIYAKTCHAMRHNNVE